MSVRTCSWSRQWSRGRERNTTRAQEQIPSNLFTPRLRRSARPRSLEEEIRRVLPTFSFALMLVENVSNTVFSLAARAVYFYPSHYRGYPERGYPEHGLYSRSTGRPAAGLTRALFPRLNAEDCVLVGEALRIGSTDAIGARSTKSLCNYCQIRESGRCTSFDSRECLN